MARVRWISVCGVLLGLAAISAMGATIVAASTDRARSARSRTIVWRRSRGMVKVPGADSLYDLGRHNLVLGGRGDNDVYPGVGDDVHGGPGRDAVIFAGGTAPVAVSLDNKPNDGTPGERVNVRSDVEEIYGGSGRSTLIGDLAPNAPPELIRGGGGDNTIVGGSGENRIYGGPGTDDINSFNGRSDVVICGTGRSTVMVDASDLLVGCTHRRAAPRIRSLVLYTLHFFPTPPVTTVTQLTVQAIPTAATVEVDCHGAGCRFARKLLKPRNGSHQLQLAGFFAGSRLGVGTRLEVRIAKPNVILKNAIGKVVVLTMQRDTAARQETFCVPPGSHMPVRHC